MECHPMMSQSKTLKPKQLNAIRLLAAGTPACQVAERLEITTMTLYRWKQLPEFEQTLNAIAYSGLEEVAKKVNIAALTAAETLQEILCDMSHPVEVRMKAALAALKVQPAINGAIEKGLQHRVADFDTRERYSGPVFTYDSAGRHYVAPSRAPTPRALPSDEGIEV